MNNGLWLGVNIFLSVCCALDLFIVMKRDLMMLQQNSYRNERYVRWFNNNNESTSPWRMGTCIALFLLLVHHLPQILTVFLAALILVFNFLSFVRKKYKKPLVFTARAKRIFIVQLLFGFALPITLGITLHSIYLANKLGILVLVLSPVFLLLANIILIPYEHFNNKKYYYDAENILRNNRSLKIIGITGSYGKTSTKHFLYHMLSQQFDTVMTPGSFNTLLGVIRTIRENLKPFTEVFIVEMGAKQPGDIREICNLVHPEIGILTSIGEQHLETFKSIENILKTKFELIQSLPVDGLAVINDTNPIVKTLSVGPMDTCYYGNNDSFVKDISFDREGSKFSFKWDKEDWMDIKTPLIGYANIENLVAAIIVARYLGVDKSKVRFAAATMPQVEHRLQMHNTSTGYTIIDDAYNSNPVGSRMALDVLKHVAGDSGRAVIITPGMIELGSEQYQRNRELGVYIGQIADMAIIVGAYNHDAIMEGIEEANNENIIVFVASTFPEAQKIMLENVKRGDVVLYENDLPDTFK